MTLENLRKDMKTLERHDYIIVVLVAIFVAIAAHEFTLLYKDSLQETKIVFTISGFMDLILLLAIFETMIHLHRMEKMLLKEDKQLENEVKELEQKINEEEQEIKQIESNLKEKA